MNEKELNFCEFKQRWSCLLIIEPKQYTTQDNIARSTKEYAKTSTVWFQFLEPSISHTSWYWHRDFAYKKTGRVRHELVIPNGQERMNC